MCVCVCSCIGINVTLRWRLEGLPHVVLPSPNFRLWGESLSTMDEEGLSGKLRYVLYIVASLHCQVISEGAFSLICTTLSVNFDAAWRDSNGVVY